MSSTMTVPAEKAETHVASTPESRMRNLERLVALLAVDWQMGDRHHAAEIHEHTKRLVDDLGEEAEAVKVRLADVPKPAVPARAPAIAASKK